MTEEQTRRIRREGAEALLDAGVSLPLAQWTLFGKKFTFRATMRRPTLGSQMRMARLYLALTRDPEEIKTATGPEKMAFLAQNGKTISRMVAVTLTRGYIARHCFEGVVAWYLRQFVEPRFLLGAMLKYVLLLGTESFMPIISLASRTDPTKPRLSRKAKGSQRVNTNTPIAPSGSSGKSPKRRAGRRNSSSTALTTKRSS